MAGKRLVAGCRAAREPRAARAREPRAARAREPRAARAREPGPHGPGSPWRDNDPEEILSRRYAAGEIDAEEYRQRLEVLRAQRHTAGTGSA